MPDTQKNLQAIRRELSWQEFSPLLTAMEDALSRQPHEYKHTVELTLNLLRSIKAELPDVAKKGHREQHEAEQYRRCKKFGCSPALLTYVDNLQVTIDKLSDRVFYLENHQ